METITGKTFRDERIVLGGTRYIKCKFVTCSLVFTGEDDEPAVDCEFVGCGFSLDGPAVNTVRFLHLMWKGGGWNIVEEMGVGIVGKPLRFGE